MIEVTETHRVRGTEGRITGLKTATCTIWPVDGVYSVQTARLCRGRRLNGSIRYRRFPTYEAALDYALAYSNRVAKTPREQQA